MEPGTAVGVVVALVTVLGVGTVAHEASHALALTAAGVECDVEWLPDRDATGLLRAGAFGTWATVTPRRVPDCASPWQFRVSSMMPLVLVSPFALVLLGALPDPVATGNPYLIAATAAWLACALPSPQDFSLFWYAERALAEER